VTNDQENIHRLLGKAELTGRRNQPQVRSDLLEESFGFCHAQYKNVTNLFCHKYFRHVTLCNFVTNSSSTSHFNFWSFNDFPQMFLTSVLKKCVLRVFKARC
jgi:hypothetical protein